MRVRESNLSLFLNIFFKNYSREEVASEYLINGNNCLDIACGDGELINKFLFPRFAKLEGIDISKSLITKAIKSKKNNCIFLNTDIDKYVDFAIRNGKKYDAIYLLAILEHIMWPAEFVKKISRIVKKGGKVVVETPNVAWLPYRINLFLGKFPVTAPTVGAIAGVHDEHIRFFTHKTMNEIMHENGFKLRKIDCSGKFRFIKNIYPKLLSPDIVAIYEK